MKKTMSKITTGFLVIAICTMGSVFGQAVAQSKKQVAKMEKRILFVVTSHDKKGSTGQPTGYYLAEVAHPWDVLHSAGYEIDFVSPKGGKAPVDGFNLEDPINKKFWDNQTYRQKVENTMKPSEVDPSKYVAILYAGGHGTMWDFPDNQEIAEIARQIYEANGVVSAVCHGPAGLVNIKLSNGKYLVDGKKINAFTNEEEVAVKLDNVVPFLLESKLMERGAVFEKSGLWQKHVTVDQRVVTGQNPASAQAVGEAILQLLSYHDFSDIVVKSPNINQEVQFVDQTALLTDKATENEAMRQLLAEKVSGNELKGKGVAVLVTDGVEEIELTFVYQALKQRGATVHIVSPRRASYPSKFGAVVPKTREQFISTVNWLQNANFIKIDKFIDEVNADQYDLLFIPGGAWNPDGLRGDQNAINLVKAFNALNKPIASLCHGPQVLISAEVVKGKETTAWWSMMIDLKNAGSIVKDEPIVISQNLITSRGPIDLAPFTKAIIAKLK